MIQLTVKSTRGSNNLATQKLFAAGDWTTMYRPMDQMTRKWPGIKSYWCGFIDPIFGRYKSIADLDKIECEAAEEETDDFMDATAQSALLESAALKATDISGEASVHNDGDGTEHIEHGAQPADAELEATQYNAATSDEVNHQVSECETDSGEERSSAPHNAVEEYLIGRGDSDNVPYTSEGANPIPLIKIRTR